MNILLSELHNGVEGSFDEKLSDLIKLVKRWRNLVGEEANNLAVEIKQKERYLNSIIEDWGDAPREFVMEILVAANKVDEDKDNFKIELEKTWNNIPKGIFNGKLCPVETIELQIIELHGMVYIEYDGPQDEDPRINSMAEDVVRSLATKYGFVFIRV